MTIISAKFKGADGSLGYEHGETYILEICEPMGYNILDFNKPTIRIKRSSPSTGQCDYRDIETFLQNWDEIKCLIS